jgi:hypothetical protein
MEGPMSAVKVTLNLPADLVEKLKVESTRLNISMTETIRRGLETELFLTSEENNGSKILIEKKDDRIVQLVRR